MKRSVTVKCPACGHIIRLLGRKDAGITCPLCKEKNYVKPVQVQSYRRRSKMKGLSIKALERHFDEQDDTCHDRAGGASSWKPSL